MSVFPREKQQNTESELKFLQSGPRKFTKSDFSGLAPIRKVLIKWIFSGVGGVFWQEFRLEW